MTNETNETTAPPRISEKAAAAIKFAVSKIHATRTRITLHSDGSCFAYTDMDIINRNGEVSLGMYAPHNDDWYADFYKIHDDGSVEYLRQEINETPTGTIDYEMGENVAMSLIYEGYVIMEEEG